MTNNDQTESDSVLFLNLTSPHWLNKTFLTFVSHLFVGLLYFGLNVIPRIVNLVDGSMDLLADFLLIQTPLFNIFLSKMRELIFTFIYPK